jgi:hypothetical protein
MAVVEGPEQLVQVVAVVHVRHGGDHGPEICVFDEFEDLIYGDELLDSYFWMLDL